MTRLCSECNLTGSCRHVLKQDDTCPISTTFTQTLERIRHREVLNVLRDIQEGVLRIVIYDTNEEIERLSRQTRINPCENTEREGDS